MKKNILFTFGIALLFSANLLLTDLPDFSTNNNLIDILQNTAYADGEPSGAVGFTCYSAMLVQEGARTLECNVPCCYRADKKPNEAVGNGGTCTGPYGDCS